MTHVRPKLQEIGGVDERTTVRFCIEDLDLAFTKLELTRIASDEYYRERQVANAKLLYERARDVLARLPPASVDKTCIPQLLRRVEEGLARVQR
jgi:hypothetical protein